MAIINLRDYYPFYTSDCFMEVSEEVAGSEEQFAVLMNKKCEELGLKKDRKSVV